MKILNYYLVIMTVVASDIHGYDTNLLYRLTGWYKKHYQLATIGGVVVLAVLVKIYLNKLLSSHSPRECESKEEEAKQETHINPFVEKCAEVALVTALGALVQSKVSMHLDGRIEDKVSSIITKYHPDQIELSSDYVDIINKHDKIRVVLKAITHPHMLSEEIRKKGYGISLKGPPGTGKSMLVKLFAKKSNSMLLVVPTPLLTTAYFGDGALTVRHIFEESKKEVLRGNRVVLFFDEFDSIGNRKSDMQGSGGESQKATLNALLTEMNAINEYEGKLVVITATNDETAIDQALTRSKRFGRSIYLEMPTRYDRLAFIQAKQKRYSCLESIDISAYLDETDSFSYADLEEVNDRVLLRFETEDLNPHSTLSHYIQEVQQEKKDSSKKNRQQEREERERQLFEMQCEQEKRARINDKYKLVDQVKGTVYANLAWQAIKNMFRIL